MISAARFLAILALTTPSTASAQRVASEPGNFVYFGRDRERIREPAFLENPAIAGAQLRYTWKELEPTRDRYELQPILDDLETLQRHGKRLFIQIQDASFSDAIPVPDYLRTDPEFSGGADRKLESDDRDPAKVRFDGWVARRWDPRVRARFIRLLEALGTALDGRIEGVNLAETAIGFENRQFHPRGFTFEGYAAGMKEVMTAARRAFPGSRVILYANFMPGDSVPASGPPSYLAGIYAHAEKVGVGVGGPDLRPHRWAQRRNSLPLIAARPRGMIAGMAVQDGNLGDLNPATGMRVSVEELYRYATERLRLDYIFWGTEEPYYSDEVLPFLRRLSRRPSP